MSSYWDGNYIFGQYSSENLAFPILMSKRRLCLVYKENKTARF
ncbi:hypothetical protein HanXRQr2_Chr16g0732801 [Helianthus annuus]|uniref:Uncharacterized protein n=1 Tax=Helianthus annuus TaxID=4232 RepID=A0A9K3GWQ1_HELAN|nr:hypothetical protein HanXRQr2_Chr16g0732801 [Helianthus annuus]KAJ0943923.1 hypothetical protein HanPSC8_Chr03g0110291 [Helianthus annuus]